MPVQRGPKSTSIPKGDTSTSLVRWERGRVTNPTLKNLLVMNIYPDCTPPIPCAENFSRGSSFFRCPAQNVTPSPCLMKIDLLYFRLLRLTSDFLFLQEVRVTPVLT